MFVGSGKKSCLYLRLNNANLYFSGERSDWTFPLEVHGAYNRIEVNGYRYLANYKKITHWNQGIPFILYITFNPNSEVDNILRILTETKYPNYVNGFKGSHHL